MNNLVAALRGEPCARVPFQELEISARQVDAVLRRRTGLMSTRLPVDDYVEFTLATGQEALYFNALWEAGRVYRADSDGRRQYVGGFVAAKEDLARIEPFDLSRATERLHALTEAAGRHGLGVILCFPSPFRLALFAMGYEEFFTRLYDEPEFVLFLIDHFRERAARCLEGLLRLPVSAFLCAASICTGSGPMLSRDMMRRYWSASTAEFLRPVVAKDVPVILHVDGDFSTISDLLLELPVAAIHPFEVCGGLDIYDFKARYGRQVAVWGNINLSDVLTRGTPDEVRRDVRLHIDRLAPGGRYILGSSHEITPNVPVENFMALVQAAKE